MVKDEKRLQSKAARRDQGSHKAHRLCNNGGDDFLSNRRNHNASRCADTNLRSDVHGVLQSWSDGQDHCNAPDHCCGEQGCCDDPE